MTLEQGKQIVQILETKRELENFIYDIQNSTSIIGDINDGHNGLAFRWERNSNQTRYLLEGAEADLQVIIEKINKITVEGL